MNQPHSNVMSIEAITCPKSHQCKDPADEHIVQEMTPFDQQDVYSHFVIARPQSELIPCFSEPKDTSSFGITYHPPSAGFELSPTMTDRRQSNSSSCSSSISTILSTHSLNPEPYSLHKLGYKKTKEDSINRRRERNKLASAKYRAKKQVMTMTMQSQIMQLAREVAYLRDELEQAKKNETDMLYRYQQLQQFCKSHHH
ncbi:hypothetical protein RMATCC62417_09936 [Rhizopus microsporus]|nr:hypothetical protein RMATCC62417_09936 [Rhizopus microsporus]